MDSTPIGRIVHALARFAALAGGAVLIVITVVTVVSIAGRILLPVGPLVGIDFGPIAGDYEIVEAGMGFAIFAFLPWCMLTRGHAVVAILTDQMPARYNAVTELIVDTAMLAVAIFITWRHAIGLIDKFGYGETTFILRLPLWWWYAGGLIGAVIFIIVAAYCVVRSLVNATSRNPQKPQREAVE